MSNKPRSTSEPKTIEQHASYLTKLVLFSSAYCMSRENMVKRTRQYLEEHFHLASAPTEAPTFHTQHPENLVRIHLRQALLLGFGQKIKYAHTLVGERQPTLGEQQDGVNFIAVNVFGFVRGGVSVTLERPAIHLLASHNILSIESLPLEKQCCEEGR